MPAQLYQPRECFQATNDCMILYLHEELDMASLLAKEYQGLKSY